MKYYDFVSWYTNFLNTILIMFKDGNKHPSPNSGYPEAALSGALNVKLAGPRTYKNTKRSNV